MNERAEDERIKKKPLVFLQNQGFFVVGVARFEE